MTHKRLIRMSKEFAEAVENYRKEHNLRTWNNALIEIASLGLGIEPQYMAWGGDHRSEEYRKDNSPVE